MAGHRLPYSRLYTHATSVILAPFRSLHPRKPAFHYAPNISYRNLRLWLAPLALVPSPSFLLSFLFSTCKNLFLRTSVLRTRVEFLRLLSWRIEKRRKNWKRIDGQGWKINATRYNILRIRVIIAIKIVQAYNGYIRSSYCIFS